MKINILKQKSVLYVLLVVVFVIIAAGAVHAQTTSSSPYITTSTTPDGGVSVNMQLPNNFKGSVYTVYKDGKWQTFSTTTPLTKSDIASMQKEMQSEEDAIQQMFAAQQKLFEQEQQMFQNIWSGLW